jgi:hypothetical protein
MDDLLKLGDNRILAHYCGQGRDNFIKMFP